MLKCVRIVDIHELGNVSYWFFHTDLTTSFQVKSRVWIRAQISLLHFWYFAKVFVKGETTKSVVFLRLTCLVKLKKLSIVIEYSKHKNLILLRSASEKTIWIAFGVHHRITQFSTFLKTAESFFGKVSFLYTNQEIIEILYEVRNFAYVLQKRIFQSALSCSFSVKTVVCIWSQGLFFLGGTLLFFQNVSLVGG